MTDITTGRADGRGGPVRALYQHIRLMADPRPSRRGFGVTITGGDDGVVRFRRPRRTTRHLALCRRAHLPRILLAYDVKRGDAPWQHVEVVVCSRCAAVLTTTRVDWP